MRVRVWLLRYSPGYAPSLVHEGGQSRFNSTEGTPPSPRVALNRANSSLPDTPERFPYSNKQFHVHTCFLVSPSIHFRTTTTTMTAIHLPAPHPPLPPPPAPISSAGTGPCTFRLHPTSCPPKLGGIRNFCMDHVRVLLRGTFLVASTTTLFKMNCRSLPLSKPTSTRSPSKI